ncbi:MAG TPA: hypothetical protein GX510_06745, partial [Firmicutes bacterium]|nr:hypothetical protein [Candidatus Fermentithermobacillaceae bacterium]
MRRLGAAERRLSTFRRIAGACGGEKETRGGSMVGPILLLLVMVAAAVAATVSRDLFTSVISLGLASAALGTFYFYLGLDYAGAFELSAGAGLITVMFVSILSMMSRR